MNLKWWDIKNVPVYPDEPVERHQMRKWLSQIPHGGVYGNLAVLVCYNKHKPERSSVIVEVINI